MYWSFLGGGRAKVTGWVIDDLFSLGIGALILPMLVGLLMLAWDESGESGLELEEDLTSKEGAKSWKLILVVVGRDFVTEGAVVMGRGALRRLGLSRGVEARNLLFTSVSSYSELEVSDFSSLLDLAFAGRYKLPRLLSSNDMRNFSGKAENDGLSGAPKLGLENFGRGRAMLAEGEPPPSLLSLPPAGSPIDSSPSLFNLRFDPVLGFTLLL